MKLIKNIHLLVASCLLLVTNAMAGNGSVTVRASNPTPNPVCSANVINMSFSGTTVDPSDSDREITITGRSWSWTATDGAGNQVASEPNGGSAWSFSWAPLNSRSSDISATVTVAVRVTFTGTDCNGAYTDTAVGAGSSSVTVKPAYLIESQKTYPWNPEWAQKIENFALGWFDFGSLGTFNYIVDDLRERDCCTVQVSGVYNKITSKYLSASQTFRGSVGSVAIVNVTGKIGEVVNNALNATGNAGSTTAASATTWLLEHFPSLTVGGIEASGASNYKTIAYKNECACNGQAAYDAMFGSESCSAICSVGAVTIPKSFLEPLGFNNSIDFTLIVGELKYERKGYNDGDSSPCAVKHTDTYIWKSRIYTHWNIPSSLLSGDIDLVPSRDDHPAPVVSVLKED